MERTDGNPQVFMPVFFAWLQPREQSATSSVYEELATRRSVPAYGLPDPEEMASARLLPDLHSAADAARQAVAGGARNAYVLWHSLAGVATLSFALTLLLNGGWVSRVAGALELGVLPLVVWHKLRRERVVRERADAALECLVQGRPEPVPEAAPRRRRTAWAPKWAVVTGVAVTVGFLGLTLDDVVATNGFPVEHARLVSATKHGANGCGRYDEPQDLVWRSSDPPAGLPATFTQVKACSPVDDVGDSVTLVRIVRGSSVDVRVNPETSYGGAIAESTSLGALAFACLGVASGTWEWWRRRRARGVDHREPPALPG